MDDTGIDFVLNRKFPRDTKDMSLVSGWYIIEIEVSPKKSHKSIKSQFFNWISIEENLFTDPFKGVSGLMKCQ